MKNTLIKTAILSIILGTAYLWGGSIKAMQSDAADAEESKGIVKAMMPEDALTIAEVQTILPTSSLFNPNKATLEDFIEEQRKIRGWELTSVRCGICLTNDFVRVQARKSYSTSELCTYDIHYKAETAHEGYVPLQLGFTKIK